MIITNDCIKEGIYAFIDIRGFTKWSLDNQLEIKKLLEIFYDCGIQSFGERKEQSYLKRIVKYLGDGFFAVNEYDPNTENDFDLIDSMNQMVASSCNLIIEFRKRIVRSSLHDKNRIGIGIGISYGPSLRFNLKGQPFDYSGKSINTASRLCSVAMDGEIVMESDIEKYYLSKKLIIPNGFSCLLKDKEPKKMDKIVTFCLDYDRSESNKISNPAILAVAQSVLDIAERIKETKTSKSD